MDQAQYFADLVAEKRTHPGDDMLSVSCDVEVEDEDGGGTTRLTDNEIVSFGTLLGAAGSETVTKLIGSGLVLFDRNPDQWQLVLDDVSTIPAAVEEILRFWPPSQYQGRLSTRDSDWHGVTIPARSPVFLITGAATHDPRHYDEPDRFDIGRRARCVHRLRPRRPRLHRRRPGPHGERGRLRARSASAGPASRWTSRASSGSRCPTWPATARSPSPCDRAGGRLFAVGCYGLACMKWSMLVARTSGASSWQKWPTPGSSTTGASGQRDRKSAMA